MCSAAFITNLIRSNSCFWAFLHFLTPCGRLNKMYRNYLGVFCSESIFLREKYYLYIETICVPQIERPTLEAASFCDPSFSNGAHVVGPGNPISTSSPIPDTHFERKAIPIMPPSVHLKCGYSQIVRPFTRSYSCC